MNLSSTSSNVGVKTTRSLSRPCAFAFPSLLSGGRMSGRVVPNIIPAPSVRSRHARIGSSRVVRAEAGTASPRDGQSDNESSKQPNGKDEDGAYSVPPSKFDWNADWSKYQRDVADGKAPEVPQGRAPPTVSEKAARKAAAQVSAVRNSLPTRQALFNDWRFWVILLLTLSLLTAAVGGSQSNQPVPLA